MMERWLQKTDNRLKNKNLVFFFFKIEKHLFQCINDIETSGCN